MLSLIHSAALLSMPLQSLPYESYRLDNGLEVILHEDHSAPEVVVNTWYHVGAKDEPRDRTGFAHLFEHLMFMGTHRAPDFDIEMEAGGAWNNASTSPDRTNYYDVGPAEMLPTLLWLEADRLENIGADMTPEKLESQRAVVMNEYRQNYENQPYAKARLATSQLLYPALHPYHIPVIGLPEHILAATVEDVQAFFETYYVPNNASLVVAGDFDSEVVKPMIAELFGTLPRGDEPPKLEVPALTIDSEKRRTVTDSVRLPMLWFAWHSPAFYAPGDAEMDLLAGVLGEAPSGRLYQALVQTGLAADVAVYQASSYLGSTFVVQVLASPDAELGEVEAIVDKEIAKLLESGVTEAELDAHRARYELALVSPLQSLRARADLLNRYAFFLGEPDGLARDLARYSDASVDSVNGFATLVLGAPGRAVVTVLPEAEFADANPRDVRPENFPAANVTLPQPEVATLSNGLEVRHWARPGVPLISSRLLLRAGSALDPADKRGATGLALEMLDEGAIDSFGNTLDAQALADQLGTAGGELSIAVLDDHSVIGLDMLSRNAETLFGLLGDVLARPAMLETEWTRVHSVWLEDLASESDDPARIAGRVERRAWFGDGHPLATPPVGTLAGVEATDLETARVLAGQIVRPANAVLFTAGDIELAALTAVLERGLGSWVDGDVAPLTMTIPPIEAQGSRIVVVDAPGATQTQERYVMPVSDEIAAVDRVGVELLATVLGGTFSSRLNSNLREDKGWTYGARSRFDSRPNFATLRAGASVQADATGPAIAEFSNEFKQIKSGDVRADEVQKARTSRRQRTVEGVAQLDGLLARAVQLENQGREFESLGDDLTRMGNANADELNALAGQLFDGGLMVLVGPRELILEQLADLESGGMELPPIQFMDAEGNRLDDLEAAPREAAAR